MELNAAYATIANGGVYIKPKLYTKVVDHDGKVILDNTGMETRQVLKPTTAYLLTSAMQDVVTSGTGGSVNFGGMAIAGKTGTTSDYNDVWFAGYTPYYTCTTWTGFDNNAKLSSSAEKNFAKTLWRAVMSRVHENLEYASFPTPGGLVTCTVCASSGKLPVPGLCDGHLVSEMFTEDTVPTETCDVHYSGTVCTYSMLPACETCPFKAQGVFELPLHEDSSLLKGTMSAMGLDVSDTTSEYYDGTIIEGEDGYATHMCPHNAIFMANPNVGEILAAQQMEMQQKAAAAAAALQAAGTQTTEGTETVNPLIGLTAPPTLSTVPAQ
jgi:penicillin-binding protein 1A